MRINYNVIWFENDEGWLKPNVRGLRTFLDDHGFKLNETLYKDDTEIENILKSIHSKAIDVDIILMDYKLAGSSKGNKIIEKIRSSNLFTEIVFYSQSEGVKQIIEKEHGSIEGIYYAGRDTFRQKVQEIIKHTIKKVEDIESMRGLIMGAVSEIENGMLDIILKYIETCGEEIKNEIAIPLFEKVGVNLNEKQGKYDEYLPKLKLKQLSKDNVLFDADKKAYATQLIINKLNHPDLEHLKGDSFYNTFKEVLTTRNKFGHSRVFVDETGLRKLKCAPPEEVFTDDRCIEIRKILIKQGETINEVFEKIA